MTEPSWFEARLPQRGVPLPQPGEALPQRGQPLPQRGEPLPPGSQPLAQRGDPLPRRVSRTRRSGRHRSPHRLTLPTDAPSLVLAVPGSAEGPGAAVAQEVAAAAALSCQGADVRVGYLGHGAQSAHDALRQLAAGESEFELRAVLVPLLAGPHPGVDAAVAELATGADVPVIVAGHLGPHPLLAEALHARLSEAGLARATRARGLTIPTSADGVLMLADRGEEAMKVAAVAAVLLAGRLAVPVVPASLGDTRSAEIAFGRLAEAGCSSLAISPCIIGPESDPAELAAFTAAVGLPQAAPLGAHPAVAQLVAMRYGAALSGLRMADSPG